MSVDFGNKWFTTQIPNNFKLEVKQQEKRKKCYSYQKQNKQNETPNCKIHQVLIVQDPGVNDLTAFIFFNYWSNAFQMLRPFDPTLEQVASPGKGKQVTEVGRAR